MATYLSDRQKKIYMDLIEIYDGDTFGAKDYHRAVASGQLGRMHFRCKDEDSMKRLRSCVLSAARRKGHILETTQTWVDEYKPDGYCILTVSFRGELPSEHERS